MKGFLAVLALGLASASAAAEETVREIAWGPLERQGALRAGQLRPRDATAAFDYVELRNAGPEARTYTLIEIEAPPIGRPRYALAGQVRHQDVEGTGYLEMWSAFPGKGRFFTRTLAPGGPLQGLSGSSAWRPFLLPFDAQDAGAPARLTFQVVLPGSGTVYIGPLRLVQYAPADDPLAATGAWWGPRTAGLLGGIAGSLVGCFGALIGILAQRGRARTLVLGLTQAVAALGAVALAFGVAALLRRQPYDVVYPLLLLGAVSLAVAVFALPTLRRRYEEMELRRMRAQDLR